MNIELREIDRRDERAAMRFAAVGMHLDRYSSGLALRLYCRHFWYAEKNRATQCIAAYVDGEFKGVLLAAMGGETAPYSTFWRRLYVKFVGWAISKASGSEDAYDAANARMLAAWRKTNDPDGELCFLAADPEHPVRGVGSALLAELERREAGRLVYLYTDDACTWQFYERWGFERVGEEQIQVAGLGGSSAPMTCMLYAKRLGQES